MSRKVIFVGTILTLVMIFAAQNDRTVLVKFLVWKFSISLAILIFLSLATGFLTGGALANMQRLQKVNGKRN